LESDCFAKKTALVRNISDDQPLRKIKEFKKGIWGVKARNREQRFVLDLLMDQDVPIVTLIGKAGCGKTLCALASGLEQVIEDQRYTRLIVTRPVEPLGRDIGFLPGTIEEKMRPWLSPIQDNLRYMMGDKHAFDMQLDRGVIEIEALPYIRGRSISDAFIIVDECQNTTVHEIKTILTRVGENTKIVLLGDIEQIDNIYIDETTNGLTYIIEKFKDHELAGHVTLRKGERSAVATLAAKVL
jgi:PhoH-like ATPase